MHLKRRGAELWAEFDDPDVPSASRITREIVLVTGSHEQQAYWYRTDHSRLLGQLPGVYLIKEHQWLPRRSVFLRPPTDRSSSETGRWNDVCINCHTTHGQRRFSAPYGSQPIESLTADTEAAEFGIACEACHGPGTAHVAANRNPLRRYSLHFAGRSDPTIVQPARLDARRSSQVCGQCHSVWEFPDRAAERRANETGFPYMPGDDLLLSRFVAQPAANQDSPTLRRLLTAYPGYLDDSFWPDGMIRVSGREYNGLIDSPCYTKAHDDTRTMSCFSCHSMHQPSGDVRSAAEWAASHQVSEAKQGDAACLQCHASARYSNGHTKHQSGSAGSTCYNCHMPYTTYGLLRGLRSHQISSPSVEVSLHTGRPNACNACHLDRSLGWTQRYLGQWYGVKPIALSDEQQSIAASLLWLLRGDAGQRALMAWAMSWPPARQASGTDWMPPFLSLLFGDPYDAVRVIAYRSLRAQPGFGAFRADMLAPAADRLAAGGRAVDAWRARGRSQRNGDAGLLLDRDGDLIADEVERLLVHRDDRRVNLRE
jgi:hypothetical protein